jgi:hypothetical protein
LGELLAEKTKGGKVKRLLTVLVGILIVGGLTFAQVNTVAGPASGTKEYFGIAKDISVPTLMYHLGWDYKINDYLEFELPDGWKWQNSPNYFLVIKTGPGGTWKADTNGDGTPTWAIVPGDPNPRYLRFRVADANGLSFLAVCNTWYLSTVATPPIGSPLGWTVKIQVPACPTSGDCQHPTINKVNTYAMDGIAAAAFQNIHLGGPYLETWNTTNGIFQTVLQFSANFPNNAVTDHIDVEQNRLYFMPGPGAGDTLSSVNFQIQQCSATFMAILASTDYFKNTIADNMSGIAYASIYGVTGHPSGASIVINVPGTNGGLFGLTSAKIWVNTPPYQTVPPGVPLDPRILTNTVDFVASPANRFCARTGLMNYAGSAGPTQPGWIWDISGTLFRSAWFGIASTLGVETTVRIANDTSYGLRAFADIYKDDGQFITGFELTKIVTPGDDRIPPNLAKTWVLSTVCSMVPGFTWDPATFNASAKGKIIITVWGPHYNVYGMMFYKSSLNHTSIPLEQYTPSSPWWEK